MSPSKVRCDGPLYIPLQDHQFECPDCPLPNPPTLNGYSDLGMTGEVWPSERLPPSLQPRPRQRRPAPPPPPSATRSTPYPPPRQPVIPSEVSAFNTFPGAARGRGRNLFLDFMASLPRPVHAPVDSSSTTRAPSPPRTRSPSPDIFLELYSNIRHPLDLRAHQTIMPSWAKKAKKESMGECVICYGEEKHLQIKCKSCGAMKVCCHCVVGVYQSINSCPTCPFKGEY